jgi:ethanolamine utilization protein EutA (predicted chaperonin)
MKKTLITLLMAIGVMTIQAEEYTYLTFETTDGAKASVQASSTTLSISGSTLTAGNKTFTLTNLSKMYFSTTDETTTDIKSVHGETTKDLLSATEIYNLRGQRIKREEATSGAYIIKTPRGNYKIIVR